MESILIAMEEKLEAVGQSLRHTLAHTYALNKCCAACHAQGEHRTKITTKSIKGKTISLKNLLWKALLKRILMECIRVRPVM